MKLVTKINCRGAWLAQMAEHMTLDAGVVSSSPMLWVGFIYQKKKKKKKTNIT